MSLDAFLTAYGESHRHPINKGIHRVAVPIIALDMIGLAWAASPVLALVAVGAALAYYARLSRSLTAGMTLLSSVGLALLAVSHDRLDAWFVPALIAVFVIAWAAQFAGHALEGKRPSFVQDLQFLLIGPLWLLADAYRRAGLRTA
jgi:uncharacterized membrane protein YGL010W